MFLIGNLFYFTQPQQTQGFMVSGHIISQRKPTVLNFTEACNTHKRQSVHVWESNSANVDYILNEENPVSVGEAAGSPCWEGLGLSRTRS